MKLRHSLLALLIASGASHAEINFSVNFSAQALSDLNATEQAYFTDGLSFWDNIITGYRDGVTRNWILQVNTFSEAAQNGGVTLGFAGPTDLFFSGVVADAGGIGAGDEFPFDDTNRFILAGGGTASFNVHPDAGALDPIVIRHEIGHALGIGTLWEDNEVHNDGNAATGNRTLAGGTPGQYMGAAALAAYQVEFDPTATFIPVELDGGSGTANGHWNMVADNFAVENAAGFDSHPGDGGPAPVVLSGPNAGESLDDEIMTGVRTGSGYISDTTIMSLYDIGFEVTGTSVVPEPSSIALFGIGAISFFLRRRR